MSPIDYENLFVYMSLIFAVCIFITLLYTCVFTGGAQVEKFGDGTDNMKDQILLLLKDLKDKETTTEADKNDLDEIIKTFSSSSVNVNDLVAIIKHLKKFAPADKSTTATEKPTEADKEPKKNVNASQPDNTSQSSTESVQIPKQSAPTSKRIPDDPQEPPSQPIELTTIKSITK